MTATSTYADWIDLTARASLVEIGFSTLGHQEAFDELWDVWQNCSQPGWDGHEAFAVKQETFSAAYQLIEFLPLGFPRPSFGAEPDGQITLEWYKLPTRIVSVSVDPDGYLHYAGLFGGSKRYGTLEFFGIVPDEIVQLVREL